MMKRDREGVLAPFYTGDQLLMKIPVLKNSFIRSVKELFFKRLVQETFLIN